MAAELVCNQCQKKILVENGIPKEDFFEGKKQWGYFSKKDNELHQFLLCEQCYDEMIRNFLNPVEITITNEVMN